ncbi:UNKNOWN [Stylonychia lemnae]|uniref:O-acyltransferase WSD1 C-terminal domain-containing protein n=1 Tax=Stylonychia lemnae TaxID=5949 RepID=A0A078AV76_STYLE|nr:UNKNOWN [Stylonychia lemnae]|eukprot:CDW85172.1 UNKNOWN [Stylonychia lemnae]
MHPSIESYLKSASITLFKILICCLFISQTSIIQGVLIYLLFDQTIHWYLEKYLNIIKVQEGEDNIFYRANLMTVYHVITKTKIKDLNSIKMQIIRNTQGIPEMRSKLVKVFNNFYYIKLSDEEFEQHLDRAISQIPEDFENEQALIDYIANHQIRDLPRESIQYRVMVKQDFNSNQSAVVFAFYHGLTDGVGFLNLLCALQDEFDSKNLPFVRQRSLNESIRRYITCIFGIFIYLKNQPQKYQDSQLCQIVMSNKPKITISKDMRVDQLKQNICRRFGCSINDLLTAASIIAMRDYCLANNITDHSLFQGMIAVNQRPSVLKKQDIRLYNNLCASQYKINFANLLSSKSMNLSFDQQFKEALSLVKDQFYALKTQDTGLSEIIALKIIAYFLPDIVIEKMIDQSLIPVRKAWSNLNGSPKPLIIGDAYSDKMMFSSYADLIDNMIFNSLSHNGYLRMSLGTQYSNLDSKSFMVCFDTIIDKLSSSN